MAGGYRAGRRRACRVGEPPVAGPGRPCQTDAPVTLAQPVVEGSLGYALGAVSDVSLRIPRGQVTN